MAYKTRTALGKHVEKLLKSSDALYVAPRPSADVLVCDTFTLYVAPKGVYLECPALYQMNQGEMADYLNKTFKFQDGKATDATTVNIVEQFTKWEAMEGEPLTLTPYLLELGTDGLCRVFIDANGKPIPARKSYFDRVSDDLRTLQAYTYHTVEKGAIRVRAQDTLAYIMPLHVTGYTARTWLPVPVIPTEQGATSYAAS